MKHVKPVFRISIFLVLLASNIGCDQISKKVARESINYGEKISLVTNHLTLTKVENSGAFLSLGDNLPFIAKLILLKVLPILAILGMLVLFLRNINLNTTYLISFAFIVGGGIGNLYDRVVYGSVTDFIHIDLYIFQTGIFNMADVSIMIGGSLFLISSLFKTNASIRLK